jgi:CDP-glucose 4,6-dehydratase
MRAQFWQGKTVFLTGHTGFKGGWLSLWLQQLGAEVYGYALAPATQPSLFEVARVAEGLAGHTVGNLQDGELLKRSLREAQPEIVFHLAAQPLVRRAYDKPIDTYATNVLGTAHLLEAVRASPHVRAVVSVTTDKCYDNKEWVWGYRESDALGGRDPYSSSKACAELITAAYRDSYLAAAGVAVATARAGNVVGGGDWSADRLVPDFFRELDAGQTLQVRYPGATRPWQHVLEPLAGYLTLAEKLVEASHEAAQAWNFGPEDEGSRTVRWILDHLGSRIGGVCWSTVEAPDRHEAGLLKLDISKARERLGWKPRWNLVTALDQTLAWHSAWRQGEDMRRATLAQIEAYQQPVEARAMDLRPVIAVSSPLSAAHKGEQA